MNAAVSLMDGLGLDGDRCIRVIPRQYFRGQSQFKCKKNDFYQNFHVTAERISKQYITEVSSLNCEKHKIMIFQA